MHYNCLLCHFESSSTSSFKNLNSNVKWHGLPDFKTYYVEARFSSKLLESLP
jgi:hypothetical protein